MRSCEFDSPISNGSLDGLANGRLAETAHKLMSLVCMCVCVPVPDKRSYMHAHTHAPGHTLTTSAASPLPPYVRAGDAQLRSATM